MFPAGSSSEAIDSGPLRPVVLKTFLKGALAVAVLSLFLQINPSTYVNYLIFLVLTLGAAALLCVVKRQTRFEIGDDGVHVKRMFHRPSVVSYDNISDVTLSQGMLARKFNCGTVFLILKGGRGSVRLMGGGTAEKLEDVKNPDGVMEAVSSKMGPFGQTD
jgi:membrane protein YdbS with pleckstrin-like domain